MEREMSHRIIENEFHFAMEILSITTTDDELEFRTEASDFAPLVIKGLAQLTRVFGVGPGIMASIIGEALIFSLPNRKLSRVVNVINALLDRLKYLDEDFAKQHLRTEEMEDLLEDVVTQAKNALTPERREYLVNLFMNSLTDAELEHIGKKKLLSLLNSINDAEIILLKFYSLPDGPERESMISKYRFIKPNLEKQSGKEPETQEEILFQAYWGHLVMSSLIFGNQGVDEKPTTLGLLLLKYIGLRDSVVVDNPTQSVLRDSASL
jgi:hypothetical protein